MRACYFIFAALCCGSIFATKLPSYMKPCSLSDPNRNRCFENVVRTAGPIFVKGVPELGISSLDPGHLGTIVINNPNLSINLTNTVLTGLSGYRLNSFSFNPEKGKSIMDFTANTILKAHYNMDGQLLILPIKGDGDANIQLTNLNMVMKFTVVPNNGYYTISDYKKSYKVGHAHIHFTNLFGGNEQLGKLALQFLNDNWSDIMTEVASPAVYQIMAQCVENVNMLLSQVPISELFL